MAKLLFLVLTLSFGIQASVAEVFNPYVKGPHEVLFKRYRIDDTGLEKAVDVWAPTSGGSFPAIVFSGSFGATLAADGTVNTVLEHVASWGYVIIAPWRLGSANFHNNFIDPTLEYLEGRIETDLIELGASSNLSVDTSRMILMGHSAGNHINVNYLKDHCGKFVAAILLSPVDGADPFGIIQDYCITPGQKLNFTMPTLTIQAGLDPVKGNILYPACAPERLSNKRFYDAMTGNRWFINATAYGHADFFEPGFVGAVEFLNFCGTDDNTDKVIYRDFTAGSIVAFSKAMLDPETYCDMLTYIEDRDKMIVDTTVEFDIDVNKCQPSTCVNNPASP